MCFCVQARGAIPIATRGHCRKATEGWIKQISVFRFHLSVLSHATCRAECGGNGREDGDYDVEDLAPSAVVVKCSHSGKDPSPCPPLYGREYLLLGNRARTEYMILGNEDFVKG